MRFGRKLAVPVDRPDLELELLAKLQRSDFVHYVIIVGERGTGKSTVIRRSLSSLPIPKGTIYLSCPEIANQFSIQLAKRTSFAKPIDFRRGYKRWVERTTKVDPRDELEATFLTLWPHVTEAAAKFKAKHGRPAILVIDDADHLARQYPDLLRKFQDYVKDCVDAKTLRVVFISSDGSTLSLMEARSSWSRAAYPFEVGEISDDKAVEYLVGNGVDKEAAERVVAEMTGGHLAALDSFVTSFGKKPFHQMLAEKDKLLRMKMQVVGLPLSRAVFRVLIRDGKVFTSRPVALRMTLAHDDSLLAANILAVHANSTYTFHDRHVQSWFRRQHDV